MSTDQPASQTWWTLGGRCGVAACGHPAVEILVFCNPLTGGRGQLLVCTDCLRTHQLEHLLGADARA